MQRMVARIISLTMALALGNMALGQAEPGDQKVKPSPGLFDQRSAASKPGAADLFDDKGKPIPKSDNKPIKPPPVASSLEGLLSQAMQSNPDIRVAEAKVREAEAELHRIWLQVAQKVIALHHSLEAQKAAVAVAETEYKRIDDLVKMGLASLGQAQHAQASLEAAKAKLATLEAEMPSLLGKLPQALRGRGNVRFWDAVRSDMLSSVTDRADFSGLTFSPDGKRLWSAGADGTVRIWDPTGRQLGQAVSAGDLLSAKPPIAGSMADRIRKALETPITADYRGKSLPDVFKDLEQKTQGITFVTRGVNDVDEIRGRLVTLHFSEPVPLSAVLQAIEDVGVLRIAVREYGFFVSSLGLPDGYVALDDFLKSRAGGDQPKTTDVEGVVKAIDSETGYLTINIGSSAGVVEGQTLDLYRTKPDAKYLGKIKVLAVRPNQSIAEWFMGTIPRGREPVQVGDQVTGRIRASGR